MKYKVGDRVWWEDEKVKITYSHTALKAFNVLTNDGYYFLVDISAIKPIITLYAELSPLRQVNV